MVDYYMSSNISNVSIIKDVNDIALYKVYYD